MIKVHFRPFAVIKVFPLVHDADILIAEGLNQFKWIMVETWKYDNVLQI